MSPANNGAAQYKQTAVLTASRGQIVLMLYEAAIKNCKRAADCIDRQDRQGKGIAIGRAHDIINELASSLDHSKGGKLSEDLEGLYNFMIRQLVKANVEGARKDLDGVVRILEKLLEGWRGAVSLMAKEGGK